jgi:predicted ribosome-associated RNA-binding protein Tma20
MNANLLSIVKHITVQYGETILEDPARLKAFFSDLAKDEPKPLRIAFGRCVEAGAYTALKTEPDAAERSSRKAAIAQRVRDEQGIDMTLCAEALDILEAAIFGVVSAAKQSQSASMAPRSQPHIQQSTAVQTSLPKKSRIALAAIAVTAVILVTGILLYRNNKSPDVYVAGVEISNDGVPVATYWKNGQAVTLDGGSAATSIFVSGSDVYVAGIKIADDVINPVYWKNGQAITLAGKLWVSPVFFIGPSIYVSGSDVYVAANLDSGDKTIATYWKNGHAVTLDSRDGEATSIFVSGSDVYVAGGAGDPESLYWKNGQAVVPDADSKGGFPISIFVSGSNVYVAGFRWNKNDKRDAVYWKNGQAVTLSSNSSNGGVANSIYASGSDVYAAGWDGDSAVYWKNSQKTILADKGSAASIFLSGSDVYVAGMDGDSAVYWKNGQKMILAYNGLAASIFVSR